MAQITITEVDASISYTVVSPTSDFAFNFEWYDSTDVEVYVDDVLQSSGYSVTTTGGTVFEDATRGGQVEFDSSQNNVTITIKQGTSSVKTANFAPGQLDIALLNTQVSRIFSVLRAQNEIINRAIVNVPSGGGLTVPVKSGRVGKFLGFDSVDGSEMVAGDLATSTLISSPMEPVVGAASLAAARTALEVVGNDLLTTEGDVVLADSSADPARLGIGTARQILRSNATTLAYDDEYGWQYLEVTTASASDDIEFTDLLSGYDHGFEFVELLPTTSNLELRAHTSPDTGGTPTYAVSAANYTSTLIGSVGVDYGTTLGDNTHIQFGLGAATQVDASRDTGEPNGLSGFVWIQDPTTGTTSRNIWITRCAYYPSGSQAAFHSGHAHRRADEAVNAIRFFFGTHATNTIASGSIKHWVRKIR